MKYDSFSPHHCTQIKSTWTLLLSWQHKDTSKAEKVEDRRSNTFTKMLFCYLQSTWLHRDSAARFGSRTQDRAAPSQTACHALCCWQQMVTSGADWWKGAKGPTEEPGSELHIRALSPSAWHLTVTAVPPRRDCGWQSTPSAASTSACSF